MLETFLIALFGPLAIFAVLIGGGALAAYVGTTFGTIWGVVVTLFMSAVIVAAAIAVMGG